MKAEVRVAINAAADPFESTTAVPRAPRTPGCGRRGFRATGAPRSSPEASSESGFDANGGANPVRAMALPFAVRESGAQRPARA